MEFAESTEIIYLTYASVFQVDHLHLVSVTCATAERDTIYSLFSSDYVEFVVAETSEVLPGVLKIVKLAVGICDA